MSFAAFALGFILAMLTLFGVPFTALIAGSGAALGLALGHGSLPWATAALAAGLVSEGLAGRFAMAGRGGLAEALSVVAYGRVLGPWLGTGVFWFATDSSSALQALRQTGVARMTRLLGIVAVLAALAMGLRP